MGEQKTDPDRLAAFSDAVIAVIITIMVFAPRFGFALICALVPYLTPEAPARLWAQSDNT